MFGSHLMHMPNIYISYRVHNNILEVCGSQFWGDRTQKSLLGFLLPANKLTRYVLKFRKVSFKGVDEIGCKKGMLLIGQKWTRDRCAVNKPHL